MCLQVDSKWKSRFSLGGVHTQLLAVGFVDDHLDIGKGFPNLCQHGRYQEEILERGDTDDQRALSSGAELLHCNLQRAFVIQQGAGLPD